VTVNGQRLASYVNDVFHTTLEPGKDTDLPLYNFWSSEAGRPYPADGRLVLEVRVIEARWLDPQSKNPTGPVELSGDDDQGRQALGRRQEISA
jgi:hypothetical protein